MRRLRFMCVLVLMALAFAGSAPGAGAAPSAGAAPAGTARLGDYFTPGDLARSRAFRGPSYAFGFAGLAVGLAVLALLGLGTGTRRLGAWSARPAGGRWWLQALVLVAVVVIGPAVATLPFSLARLFHERRYGLATQTVAGFAGDLGKDLAVRLVVASLGGLGFLLAARALPRAWPAVAAAGVAVLTGVLVFVAPIVYEPLFNRFHPVDAATRARVIALAERAGVRVGDVLVADASRRTTRQNAYVSGFGATTRVVLYDTLLAKSPPAQVDLVVAHELAHRAHGDVAKGTALAAGGAALGVLAIWALLSWGSLRAGLGAAGAGDPRVLPFLALAMAAGSLLAAPVQNGYSRHIEAAADRTALDYTHDPDAAIRLEVGLARDNLADLEPPAFVRWAFFTHPPALARIQATLDWQAAHPSP